MGSQHGAQTHPMNRILLFVAIALAMLPIPEQDPPPHMAAAERRPNVIILLSDDQRFDSITARFMPYVWHHLAQENPYAFTNSFVPNPLCCPSRTSILTGRYSHTTGVWNNLRPTGGFHVFHHRGEETDTIAVDFERQGYRTAMIGKYLNQYGAGTNTYVPPGWNRWFATNTGAYYSYPVTTQSRSRRYGHDPHDYITRVLSRQANRFVDHAVTAGVPFFLYLSFTAPHAPTIPDPRDVGRFAGVSIPGVPHTRESNLETAFGIDRAVRNLLNGIPSNTIVVYLADNGLLWGEHKGGWGPLEGKGWPYSQSARIPLIYRALDPSLPQPVAATDDFVLNVDLRTTLTHAAGIEPISATDGIDWTSPTYAARSAFPLEHYSPHVVPPYCGLRTRDYLYVRFHDFDGTYHEEVYREPSPEDASDDIVGTVEPGLLASLREQTRALCDPGPPGYSWPR